MDQPYTPQCVHSHRQHLPTRATTQEFLLFIHHPESQLKRCHSEPQLKECHVLNPYPEPQLKGYVPSHNSKNTSKPTFEISLKPCKPRTIKQANHFCLTNIAWHYSQVVRRKRLLDRLARDTYRQAPSASEPIVLQTSSGGTTFTALFRGYHLAVQTPPPDDKPVTRILLLLHTFSQVLPL